MRQSDPCDRYPDEPDFDLPPRVGLTNERRLAGRAWALWSEGRDGRTPAVRDYHAAAEPLALDDFTANSIMLGIGTGGVVVDAVSPEVASAFGLACGPLAERSDGLAARLLAAAETLPEHGAALPLEALLAPSDGSAATLLTRGVVLPLADDDGRVVGAHVVVTWKETLSPAANERLRLELGQAYAQTSPNPAVA